MLLVKEITVKPSYGMYDVNVEKYGYESSHMTENTAWAHAMNLNKFLLSKQPPVLPESGYKFLNRLGEIGLVVSKRTYNIRINYDFTEDEFSFVNDDGDVNVETYVWRIKANTKWHNLYQVNPSDGLPDWMMEIPFDIDYANYLLELDALPKKDLRSMACDVATRSQRDDMPSVISHINNGFIVRYQNGICETYELIPLVYSCELKLFKETAFVLASGENNTPPYDGVFGVSLKHVTESQTVDDISNPLVSQEVDDEPFTYLNKPPVKAA